MKEPQIRSLSAPGISDKASDEEIAKAARAAIMEAVLKNGGHMASNLGAVELTIALHRVFDPAVDRLVWDVGHQAYTHKWLTGRNIAAIRTQGGPSGFPKPEESPADAFGTGHASTAISAALGLARARDRLGQQHDVVAIVGDGALTGGMCYEALCDAGSSNTRMIVVLNDNQMSISRNVGAINEVLASMRSGWRYNRFKLKMERFLKGIPLIGGALYRVALAIKNVLRLPFVKHTLFEDLGFKYLGPVDGHDVDGMVRVLKRARRLPGPVLIHAVTVKGRGLNQAEDNPEDWHGVDGACAGGGIHTAASLMGQALTRLASQDERVVAITAAMCKGTGLSGFAFAYPDRFYDVGIAEEHAVTLAAGLAMGGLRPVVALYSTFLQRGIDQLLHDICLQKLPVVVVDDHCGPVGADGETHQGIYDLGMLRVMPGLCILSPASPVQLEGMLAWALGHDGPVVIRLPRGEMPLTNELAPMPREVTRWQLLRDGEQITIACTGEMARVAMDTADWLAPLGVSVAVVLAGCLHRVDDEMLMARQSDLWVTLEGSVGPGGLGEMVCGAMQQMGLKTVVHALHVGDRPLAHADVPEQLHSCGISAPDVAESILQARGWK
nr:1-deoxy-D-xylulose-5-phosphate synthase [bacterium]